MQARIPETSRCAGCLGSGETPTDYGMVDCPDCGGAGFLPSRNVLVEWRARDIERALSRGRTAENEDVRWLLAELRRARDALNEINSLANELDDEAGIATRIRFTANQALRLYGVTRERK